MKHIKIKISKDNELLKNILRKI